MKRIFGVVCLAASVAFAAPARQQKRPPAVVTNRPHLAPTARLLQSRRRTSKVITKDAKTTPGVFTVHRIKDKVLYEIPKGELGKDFLWVSQIAKNIARRRLRRPGGGQPGCPLGTEGQPGPAALGVL